MAKDDDSEKRAGKARGRRVRADKLIGRFPLTRLAEAVAVRGDARRRALEGFVRGAGRGTYGPTRAFMRRLYGSHGAEEGAVAPLIADLPSEPWEKIKRDLIDFCDPEVLADNLELAELIYIHAREEGYQATNYDERVLRTGRSIVPVPINMFLTQGERLIFQYPHLWRTPLTPEQENVIATIIALVCADGDFAIADIEIVSFLADGPPSRRKSRTPAVRPPRKARLSTIGRSRFLSREDLQNEIDDVYALLRELAES